MKVHDKHRERKLRATHYHHKHEVHSCHITAIINNNNNVSKVIWHEAASPYCQLLGGECIYQLSALSRYIRQPQTHISLPSGRTAPISNTLFLGFTQTNQPTKEHLDRFFTAQPCGRVPDTHRQTDTNIHTDHAMFGNDNNNNKWSKNFEEKQQRRIVTPRSGEWIRPDLIPSSSLGPHESTPPPNGNCVYPRDAMC